MNGRTHGIVGERHAVPDGERAGFTNLTRDAFKALGVFNKFGDTARAYETLGKMHNMEKLDIDTALQVWKANQ